MPRITEARDVQDQLINYLQGIGWTYLPPQDCAAARHHDETEPFLPNVLREQLAALNQGWLNDEQIEEVVRRLRILPADLEGNERFLHALRGHWTAYDPAEQRERNLILIDYEHPDRNRYHFTQELLVQDRERRRLDMVLWINGLPVLLVENKSPKLENPGGEAFGDVQNIYTPDLAEFMKYPIAFAAAHRSLEYGATWNARLNAFYTWKVDGSSVGLERLAKHFFDRAQVLRLLRDYTIFYRSEDAVHKFLLRPHQMRAAQKIVLRVMTNLPSQQTEEAGPKVCHGQKGARTGLEWHTQGSGKTLTMIVAAHMLRREPLLENPTLLILVDRIDLEQQMVQNLEAFGFPAVERARSKNHLRRLLGQDYRGLIVSTIHKFEGMPAGICTRHNVVVLADEAHRSQEGELGVFMRAALPNAFHFGFTGTPIDRGKVGRGAFELYGKPDPDGYHDKYSIAESIEDEATVPLFYTLAPTDIWVDKPELEAHFSHLREEFFDTVEEEGVATQEALSRLLQRADKLLAVLKAPARVHAIAQHVAQHFRENVEVRGFKALLVTVDRETCALYKEALDQHLPPEWTTVVYSPGRKDPELLRRYHLDEEAEKRVRKAFRDPEQNPKILIVTEKLLTGFDAPIAYAMYLDKPLKDHTLLQAIARVNRPYPPHKTSGLIVDYMGVFENLQRALSFDQATVATGLIDLQRLKERFADLMDQVEETLAPVDIHNPDGRVQRAIEHFFDPDRRQVFFSQFKELQDAYEILSPDLFLRPYLDRYALVADVYLAVYNELSPRARQQRLERDLLRKTDALIREHVGAGPVAAPLPLYPINRHIADVIKADDASEQVKVINLQRSILAHIEEVAEAQPYLLSIGEEVEEIIRQLHERQISVQTALERLQNKAEKIVTTGEARSRSQLDNVAFALGIVLRAGVLADRDPSDRERIAQRLAESLSYYQGWAFNSQLERDARLELYRLLMSELGSRRGPHVTVGETAPTWVTETDMEVLKKLVNELLHMHKVVAR